MRKLLSRILNRRMAEDAEDAEEANETLDETVLREHAIAVEDLLSRGDAFIDNATRVVLELREFFAKQTDKS